MKRTPRFQDAGKSRFTFYEAGNGRKTNFIRIDDLEAIDGAQVMNGSAQVEYEENGENKTLNFHRAVAFGDLAEKLVAVLKDPSKKIKVMAMDYRDNSFINGQGDKIERLEMVIQDALLPKIRTKVGKSKPKAVAAV